MNGVALHSIELCAGVGMLGEGARAAFEHLGIRYRTVCYVEREAPAAAQLVALMEAGAIDSAPIWPDLLTFDGAAWRGRVDCVVAGFPCQDLSVAGRRAGLDGKRSGLFFNVLDIADDCGAWLLVLENVSGIASATASVVDAAGVIFEERAASRVVGELADRGWNAEWTHIRASDVGASHQRERWFCVAWRVVDAVRDDGCDDGRQDRRGRRILKAGNELGDAGRQCDGAHKSQLVGRCDRAPDVGAGGAWVGDPARDGRDEGRPESAGQRGGSDAPEHGGAVGDPDEQREQQSHDEDGAESRERAWGGAGGASMFLADTDGGRRRIEGDGNIESTWVDWRSGPIFAPGPLDPRWPGIVADRPDLAPAVEPGVRMLADGMAYLVDESRNHQLRQVGNGVVPLQAAVAIFILARRAGLFT